jgi:hypothetical protein
MVYLLDANILITASNDYYPVDQVPEFWDWLQHRATSGFVKIPMEIMEQIKAGRLENDPLLDWLQQDENADALQLEETVDARLCSRFLRLDMPLT